jgi:hypothetical protein
LGQGYRASAFFSFGKISLFVIKQNSENFGNLFLGSGHSTNFTIVWIEIHQNSLWKEWQKNNTLINTTTGLNFRLTFRVKSTREWFYFILDYNRILPCVLCYIISLIFNVLLKYSMWYNFSYCNFQFNLSPPMFFIKWNTYLVAHNVTNFNQM